VQEEGDELAAFAYVWQNTAGLENKPWSLEYFLEHDFAAFWQRLAADGDLVTSSQGTGS
jgi:hypothetical protein